MRKQQEVRTVAAVIAAQLDERSRHPARQIRRIVGQYGVPQALAWTAQAEHIFDAGGVMTSRGVPRTLGGVFFHLVKHEIGHAAFRGRIRQRGRIRRRRVVPIPLPAFSWDERQALLTGLLTTPGEVMDVKITLIGRPGAVKRLADCVVTTMQATRGPSLPRGLPSLPANPTPYAIYINRRQWAAVADQLHDPNQVLVIEGWAAYDPAIPVLAVYAMRVQTELSQAAKNRQQQEQTP
jgi:hypothetical protein